MSSDGKENVVPTRGRPPVLRLLAVVLRSGIQRVVLSFGKDRTGHGGGRAGGPSSHLHRFHGGGARRSREDTWAGILGPLSPCLDLRLRVMSRFRKEVTLCSLL